MDAPATVTMTCMTTKQKFETETPEVVVLRNGRYAYRVQCPWKGKHDKTLVAFKFCTKQAYLDYTGTESEHLGAPKSEHSEEEQREAPESEHSEEEEERTGS